MQLTAPQAVGSYVFQQWTLNGQMLAKGQRTLSIGLDTDQTAAAIYTQ